MSTESSPTTHTAPDLSVLVVSFNTCNLLRKCLEAIPQACQGLSFEIIVVDNASHDGSADMVAAEFPDIALVRAPHNMGFAGANNLGQRSARGMFVALVNSDAFGEPAALTHAVTYLRAHPEVAMMGGPLIGKKGQHEPSARMFPSPLNDLLAISGLAARYAKSRFFGRFDRTWADPMVAADVDWVPGAYCVISQAAIARTGFFDERFFLYYEEVDLCKRLKQAGYRIVYRPELRATHWGGESSKAVAGQAVAKHGRQLTLWRMRSELLYYRKQHGWLTTKLAAGIEIGWHLLRGWRNRHHPDKAEESASLVSTMRQAWHETRGGLVSPPTPW